jgi:hypothetical protein
VLAAAGVFVGLVVVGPATGFFVDDRNFTGTRGFITPVATSVPTPADNPDPAAVLATLDSLPIKGRAPKTGYDRKLFGPAWREGRRAGAGRPHRIRSFDSSWTHLHWSVFR